MSSLSDRFDSSSRAKWRHQLLARGQVLATLLADVLAGKDKTPALAALGLERPGIRPEEALRQALDQIEARRLLLDREDDHFGRCAICGADLGPSALSEMPWADRCVGHAQA